MKSKIFKNASFSQQKYRISIPSIQSKSGRYPKFWSDLQAGSNPNSTKVDIVQSNPSPVQCSSLLLAVLRNFPDMISYTLQQSFTLRLMLIGLAYIGVCEVSPIIVLWDKDRVYAIWLCFQGIFCIVYFTSWGKCCARAILCLVELMVFWIYKGFWNCQFFRIGLDVEMKLLDWTWICKTEIRSPLERSRSVNV